MENQVPQTETQIQTPEVVACPRVAQPTMNAELAEAAVPSASSNGVCTTFGNETIHTLGKQKLGILH